MITVVDYGMGNLRSVTRALESQGADALVTSDPGEIRQAEKLVLPGVGAFADGIANVERVGLREALNHAAMARRVPTLGICLGMQMMALEGDEGGTCRGLGWFEARVKRLHAEELGVKVPHVGWTEVEMGRGSPLLRGIPSRASFYFVHSYHLACSSSENVVATATHGERFAAIVGCGNVVGTQFHPEKSQEHGLRLLANFIDWDGR